MVLTDDDALAATLRRDRHQGQIAAYEHESIGACSRLDAIQAAALHVKLRWLDDWNARRRAHAVRYRTALRERGLAGRADAPVVVPEDAGPAHVWHQFVVRARDRDALRAHLARAGIGTMVYYPIPLHRQPALRAHAATPLPLPETERACAEVLALPIYPELRPAQIERVADAIAAFYRAAR
jgi:dTDP-4-amino-4,6-dideoxygalactose transaminase